MWAGQIETLVSEGSWPIFKHVYIYVLICKQCENKWLYFRHEGKNNGVNIVDGEVLVVQAEAAYDVHGVALFLPVFLRDQLHGLLERELGILERLPHKLLLHRAVDRWQIAVPGGGLFLWGLRLFRLDNSGGRFRFQSISTFYKIWLIT